MPSSSWRSNRRVSSSSSGEHIVFVLVVLLAAIISAHHLRLSAVDRQAIEISFGVVAGVMLVLILRISSRFYFRLFTKEQTAPSVMSGIEFEHYVANLLRRQGYTHVRLTEHYDYGLDIIAEKANEIWGIQVKRHSNPVTMLAVRQAVAALKYYGCDRAMVITNSSFTPATKDLAASNNCLLIDKHQLALWQKAI